MLALREGLCPTSPPGGERTESESCANRAERTETVFEVRWLRILQNCANISSHGVKSLYHEQDKFILFLKKHPYSYHNKILKT